MRRRHSLWLRILGSAATLTLYAAPCPAQEDAARDGEFPVQRFEPAPGSKNYLSVERVRMEGTMGFSAGLMFDYARDPFVVRSCRDAENCDDPNALSPEDVHVIRNLLTWNLLASFTPIPIVQIGLRFPFIYASGDGIDTTTGGPAADGLSAFSPGDPALEGKFRLAGGPEKLYAFGGAVDVRAPLGHAASENNYIGSSSPIAAGVRAILDFEIDGASFGFNVGGLFRTDARLGTTTVGPEFRYGVGAGYAFNPIFSVLAEGYGGTRFVSSGSNALEIDAAVRAAIPKTGLSFTLGGGLGILDGVGSPAARVLAGALFTHEVGDHDGDKIDDPNDKCPDAAEDYDEFEDTDGCPDEDDDGDKIPDIRDKCRLAKENLNGKEDEDGCPDY